MRRLRLREYKVFLTQVGITLFANTAYALEPGATLPRANELPTETPSKAMPLDLFQSAPAPLTKPTQPDSTTLRFILHDVHFSGNRAFTDAELKQVLVGWFGQPVSRMDLETIRFQLTQYYRQAGYIYSIAVLPSQHIQHGEVHFNIVESRLSAIQITGAEGLSDAYIQQRLQDAPDEPFNQHKLLERFQLLLSDPLIEYLNGSIKPGAQPDESILDLTVKRRQPYALNVTVDNYTTPSVGAYTGRLNGTVRNLTSWGDFFQFDLNGSEGLQGLGALFSLPIAASQTRLNLDFQGNHAEIIDAQLRPLNITNDFYHVGIGLSHPILLTPQRTFSVEGQFAYRFMQNFILGRPLGLAEGSENDGTAKVSVLRFIQNYTDRNKDSAFSLRSTFSVGLDLFDATTNDSQPDSRFFSWLGQIRYAQKLNFSDAEAFFRGDIQTTSEALLPIERFALGGVYTIRGYRQNTWVRDNGYALSAELRYPLLSSQNKQSYQLTLVPFIDYGAAWNHDESAHHLCATGLGLQWHWHDLTNEFYWAYAIINQTSPGQQPDIQDDGIHFRLSYNLL